MGNEAQLADKARQLLQEGKHAEANGFMKIGCALSMVAEFKLFKLDSLTSFNQYIAQEGIKHGTAFNRVRVWRAFNELDVSGINTSRLIELAPLKMTPEEKQEAIAQAKVLTFRDFKNYVREKKGKKIPVECKHDGESYRVCRQCQARIG